MIRVPFTSRRNCAPTEVVPPFTTPTMPAAFASMSRTSVATWIAGMDIRMLELRFRMQYMMARIEWLCACP
eukprot:1443248-Pleurochrysis_carterae.AAC.1